MIISDYKVEQIFERARKAGPLPDVNIIPHVHIVRKARHRPVVIPVPAEPEEEIIDNVIIDLDPAPGHKPLPDDDIEVNKPVQINEDIAWAESQIQTLPRIMPIKCKTCGDLFERDNPEYNIIIAQGSCSECIRSGLIYFNS